MAESIIHTFHTTKPNSSDSSLVSSNAWEDGHTLQGGINGQALTYDNTMPKNIRWRDGLIALNSFATITVSTVTPIAAFAPLSFTCLSAALGLFSYTLNNYVSVGAALGTFALTFDGVDVAVFTVPSSTVPPASTTFVTNISAGVHTVAVHVTIAGNANITAGGIRIDALIAGR